MRFAALIIAALLIATPVTASATKPLYEKFPKELWLPTLLRLIENGPQIFTRDDQYQLNDYPANHSEEVKKEIEYLHSLVPLREEKGMVSKILYENSGVLVRDVFAKEGLLAEGNYKTIEIMDMIDKDLGYFILASKQSFSRVRPSHIDIELTTVMDNPRHAAYPSGHAAQAYMVALILADFDSENAKKYKNFAKDIAHRREIAGVHFPSDTKAGIEFAEHFYDKFRSITAFEKKYQDAKLTYIKPKLHKEED